MRTMLELLKRSLLTGVGLLVLTKEKAEELARDLIKEGELRKEDSKAFVDSLMKRAEKEREELNERLTVEVRKILNTIGVVSRDEVNELKRRIEELEKRSSERSGGKS